jgi:transposase
MSNDTRIAVDVAKALGHRVALLPPHPVRPYIRRNKTDRTDTKGILEASRNEEIHPYPSRRWRSRSSLPSIVCARVG